MKKNLHFEVGLIDSVQSLATKQEGRTQLHETPWKPAVGNSSS
jgi:hypothetical protein